MSKTALAWLTLYVGAIVLSFVNPLYPLLAYLLEYYMRPSLWWWGAALPDYRWNLVIAVVVAAAFFMNRLSLRELRPVRNLALPWLVGLGVVMLLVTGVLAVNPEQSWTWMVQWTKMAVIIPLLMIGILRTRGAFDAFVAVHMVGALWWGWEAFQDPERVAGRLVNVGSGDTQNDNAAAIHLLTVIPFIIAYLVAVKETWLRVIALVAAPFVVNTFILCNSRGGTIGLIAAGGATLLVARKGHRVRMVGLACAAAVAFLWLADPEFIERQGTISRYEEDGAAIQRIQTWTGAVGLVMDHPLGVGGRGFHELSPTYIPEIVAEHDFEERAPHNTYVMVVSEWGIPGLFLFLGFLASTFVMLHRVRKRAPTGDSFYYYRSVAVHVSLVGVLVAAIFTDRLYGEALYWMCALAYVLYRMQVTDLAEQAEDVSAVPVTESAATPIAWAPVVR